MQATDPRATRTPVRIGSIMTMAVALTGLATGAAAQDSRPPLVTDRPDQTESTATVARGAFQLEAGLTWAQDSGSPVRLRRLDIPGTLLRIGLAGPLEGRIGFEGWRRFTGDDSKTSGFGDLDVGFKYRAVEGNGAAPSVALIGTLVLPTGDDDVTGSDSRLDPSVRLAFAHALTDRLGLGYNVAVDWVSGEDGTGVVETTAAILYTITLGVALGGTTGAFIEAFGDKATWGGRWSHSADAGLTWQLTPTFQLDVAGGVGLNAAAPDWFGGLGASVRVPR